MTSGIFHHPHVLIYLLLQRKQSGYHISHIFCSLTPLVLSMKEMHAVHQKVTFSINVILRQLCFHVYTFKSLSCLFFLV